MKYMTGISPENIPRYTDIYQSNVGIHGIYTCWYTTTFSDEHDFGLTEIPPMEAVLPNAPKNQTSHTLRIRDIPHIPCIPCIFDIESTNGYQFCIPNKMLIYQHILQP